MAVSEREARLQALNEQIEARKTAVLASVDDVLNRGAARLAEMTKAVEDSELDENAFDIHDDDGDNDDNENFNSSHESLSSPIIPPTGLKNSSKLQHLEGNPLLNSAVALPSDHSEEQQENIPIFESLNKTPKRQEKSHNDSRDGGNGFEKSKGAPGSIQKPGESSKSQPGFVASKSKKGHSSSAKSIEDGAAAALRSCVENPNLGSRSKSQGRSLEMDAGGHEGGGGAPSPAGEARLKVEKAKLRMVEQERDIAVVSLEKTTSQLNKIQAQLKDSRAEVATLAREKASAVTELQKMKARLAKAEAEAKSATATAASVRAAEARNAAEARAAVESGSAKDAKLNRALEEVSRLKAALGKVKATSQAAVDEARSNADEASAELRRANKQKSELLSAFRKQTKLIDVLRRQKIHLEAAKVLSIAEDDFAQVLSTGSSTSTLSVPRVNK